MGSNLRPIDPSMTREKAISQGGYYNTDGDWNCIITLDKYPGKILRGRVETLILKDGKLFMFKKDNGDYRIPGGGFDRGVLNIDQAFIETKEEAKIIVDNLKFTGVKYVHMYDKIWANGENAIPYDGTYNEVYLAIYKDDYVGYIRKGLSDMELTNKGKFYDLNEIKDILKEPHKQALKNVFNGIVTESEYSADNDLILTAMQFQKTLKNLHKEGLYLCIDNTDIESDDGGYVFAQYNTSNQSEINDVKRFVSWCNELIMTSIYTGYVDEPISYNGYGFLYIKNE